ncbi:hypothetical protein GCM10027567_13480 [Spongiibacter taiwanensis]
MAASLWALHGRGSTKPADQEAANESILRLADIGMTSGLTMDHSINAGSNAGLAPGVEEKAAAVANEASIAGDAVAAATAGVGSELAALQEKGCRAFMAEGEKADQEAYQAFVDEVDAQTEPNKVKAEKNSIGGKQEQRTPQQLAKQAEEKNESVNKGLTRSTLNDMAKAANAMVTGEEPEDSDDMGSKRRTGGSSSRRDSR